MSLLLANLLSTLMAIASLVALIVVARKANNTIRLGKVLALRIAAASNGVEKVVKTLQTERAELLDETIKLEARLTQTARAKQEVQEVIEELGQLHNSLTHHLLNGRNLARECTKAKSILETRDLEPTPKSNSHLPIFVHSGHRKFGAAKQA